MRVPHLTVKSSAHSCCAYMPVCILRFPCSFFECCSYHFSFFVSFFLSSHRELTTFVLLLLLHVPQLCVPRDSLRLYAGR